MGWLDRKDDTYGVVVRSRWYHPWAGWLKMAWWRFGENGEDLNVFQRYKLDNSFFMILMRRISYVQAE